MSCGRPSVGADLEEHVADEGDLAVDRRAAEHIADPQRQRHVLDHVRQKFEAVRLTHEVQRVVYRGKVHENILQ